jgi:serine/threonine protein kinase
MSRYVHSAGFAFADLKTENVVLMESGHAKLTDFGGARPLTDAARAIVRQGRRALRELPSGDDDWRIERDKQTAASSGNSGIGDGDGGGGSVGGGGTTSYAHDDGDNGDNDDDPQGDELDTRIEGTAAYLAPEIAAGGSPSVAGDCWGFGCLVFQMLAGRPPLWAETVADTMAAIVRFESSDTEFPDSFPIEGRALVTTLLDPQPSSRGTLGMAASHAFFNGLDVHVLYTQKAPELAVGAVGPAPDAKWARRQNSMLWQPMPDDITASAPAQRTAVPGLSFSPIEETSIEARAPFVSSLDAVSERRV